MKSLLVDASGVPLPPSDAPEVIHPQREKGYEAGAASAPNEKLMEDLIELTIGYLLDETQPVRDLERSYENLLGFLAGYNDMMAVKPLLFLTRQQTAKVERLPRRIRRAWFSEYERGVRAWRKRGGTLVEGNRPVLPEIPG